MQEAKNPEPGTPGLGALLVVCESEVTLVTH